MPVTEPIKNKPSGKTVVLIALLLTAVLSVFVVAKFVTAPEFNAATIASLDAKKDTVMRLALAAAASSTALSLIPGDAAMPIADQIAGLTSYFIVILAAILLEKMLVTVVGYVVFTYIIPAACLLGVLYVFFENEAVGGVAIKLALFGVVLFAAIPVSIHVSDLIDDAYRVSVEQTLATAEQNKGYIEEKKKALTAEDENWMGKIEGYLSGLTSKIGNDLSAMVKKGEATFAAFLEAIAVLIITSCVIPIVVLLIFAWIIRILFGFDSGGAAKLLRGKMN